MNSPAVVGVVIDTTTHKPVPQVSIVAAWGYYDRTAAGRQRAGKLAVYGTSTDDSGQFILKQWGPRTMLAIGRVPDDEPRVFLIKRGYEPRVVMIGSAVRRTIQLVPFNGSMQDYGTELDTFDGVLGGSIMLYQHPCYWTAVAPMATELEAARQPVRQSGYGGSSSMLVAPSGLTDTCKASHSVL